MGTDRRAGRSTGRWTFSIACRVWKWAIGVQTTRPFVGVEWLDDEAVNFAFHIGFFPDRRRYRLRQHEIDGLFDAAKLADASVTPKNLRDGAVTTDKLR